jgi:hypothetical protein
VEEEVKFDPYPEALTTPTLLSRGERRRQTKNPHASSFPLLDLWERRGRGGEGLAG